jgi:bifunctional ADP-heptose synthase (sugar kinase/adenylyltransferase)
VSSPPLLTAETVECVLSRISSLTIGVLGDLFLDRYLDLDARLTEPSLETGLDAYQVVQVRSYPGAAGTVINNLAALGVGRILPFAVLGDDGEGYELRQALARLSAVDAAGVFTWPGRRTPTYTKPMLHEAGGAARELNRLDIHNRSFLPAEAEGRLLERLAHDWPALDGLIVLDQVSQPDCGVVTGRVRLRLGELAREAPARPVLADSRERIGLFEAVSLKPNAREAQQALPGHGVDQAVVALANRSERPVYCTRGERGVLLFEPAAGAPVEVPGYPVTGPIDPVGAGDSTSAGIICALAAGATPAQAAAFGNLVASITVQQLGTTGTATPAQVRERFR